MVVAAHPLAVDAGLAMLRRGGAAVDAAIAAQLVLNLVEPQSSGIGGGGFLLHWDARRRRLESLDGRETAPAEAAPDLFLDEAGRPLDFLAAAVGGRAVGTPGLLRMLEAAHRAHGRLPWRDLFAPAIGHAFRGFTVSPRLAALIAGDAALCREAQARALYCEADGSPKPAGGLLRNPAFGETLIALADGGAAAFYRDPIAADLVAAVRGHPRNPGRLSGADLAGYRAQPREPLCAPYRGRWRVCSIGMPSSGGATMLQTLGMLEHFALSRLTPGSAEAMHLVSEAYRLAYADRGYYMADADFAAVPLAGLLDRRYLAARAALIDPGRANPSAAPGTPPGAPAAGAPDTSLERPATTHLSVVDARGNAVSLTTSIEAGFGSRLMVRGFLLNNQLTDFSFLPADAAGRPAANRVEPGKRPRSSMAPTMVFDRQGRLRLVLGSPGGASIIQYVSKTLIGVLDWNLDLQSAIDLPNFGASGTNTVLEKGSAAVAQAAGLQARGHRLSIVDLTSGLHAIAIDADGRLTGAADPRREGVARGDSGAAVPAR